MRQILKISYIKIFRAFNIFKRRQFFWAGLLAVMLMISGLLFLTYLNNNRNHLILNPFVKAGLPVYRELRELMNNAVWTLLMSFYIS